MTTDPVRILVVDDHPNTANTLARALAQLGPAVDVTAAISGQDALEKVQGKGVDILFTDMIMPEMTGLELIEKMQHHPGGRPSFTYLVTAFDVPGLKITAQRLKVNAVIVKPVRPEYICQIATQAMQEMHQAVQPVKMDVEARKKFKILVADDTPDNVTLLVRYLQSEGYDYISAQDGVEALEKVRAELPDLVLLDLNMPQKGGFTVLQEIRTDPAVAHIPVIILTAARLNPSDVQSGFNMGADDYVTKPFDRHELMARIRSKLRVKEAEDIIRRRNRELSILPEIGKELSARLDINELISIVLRRSVETLGAISGYILILNPGSASLKKSYSASNIEMDFPKLEEFLEEIEDSRQGLVIRDTVEDKRWQTGQINLFHSAVIVPMFGRNTLLGLLVLAHEQTDYFEAEHLLLLHAIASQAAIAIENARLYADVAKEQQRLSAVLQSAANAILMFDAEGCLTLLNPAGEKLFTDHETKLGLPLARESGYDALIALREQACISNESKTGEVTWPDERTFTVLLTPIQGGGCVSVLQDVTHFKNLERVKNEFISTASHDLKNPLGVISGFSELLIKKGSLNEEQTGFVNHINAAAANMNELVESMLDLAKIDMNTGMKIKRESVEMNALVSELTDEFLPQANAKEQVLSFRKPIGEFMVEADSFQLHQALRNLIGNAIKYTPVKGTIEISIEAGNQAVTVEVKDNGYGIPTADLPFIFDRFYRVREGKNAEMEGNGLGLAIVKSIIEQHKGQISVTSEPNKGSSFTMALPLVQQDLSTVENQDLSKSSSKLIPGQ
jgi:signal transduction histidine kinase